MYDVHKHYVCNVHAQDESCVGAVDAILVVKVFQHFMVVDIGCSAVLAEFGGRSYDFVKRMANSANEASRFLDYGVCVSSVKCKISGL